MQIKQMGEFLEVECCSCGECLLIGDGDKINFRSNGDEEPQGFLCAVCYKDENPSGEQSLIFKRHIVHGCMVCNKEYDPNAGFQNLTDDNGDVCGVICPDCLKKE